MEKLKVKEFGPLKAINITLKSCVVLIGPQSSGKSAIAKLVSILRDPRFISNKQTFNELLESFDIKDYLKSNTEILYTSKRYSFKYLNGSGYIVYKNESFQNVLDSYEGAKAGLMSDEEYKKERTEAQAFSEKLKSRLEQSVEPFDADAYLDDFKTLMEWFDKLQGQQKQQERILKLAQDVLSYSKYSIYIPSDRNLYSTILNSSFSLTENQIPIPKTMQRFGSLMESAQANTKEFDIDFLNVHYSWKDNQHLIEDKKAKNIFLLSNASSGLQSLIPLMQVLEANCKTGIRNTFVVEEPELNLFPKAQYELLKIIIAKSYYTTTTEEGDELIVTTHSPYCLSAMNNMLFAFKANQITKQSSSISKIISPESWIDPNNFTAYYLENGKARSIVDKSTGLIDENELDSTSQYINDDFENIFNITQAK